MKTEQKCQTRLTISLDDEDVSMVKGDSWPFSASALLELLVPSMFYSFIRQNSGTPWVWNRKTLDNKALRINSPREFELHPGLECGFSEKPVKQISSLKSTFPRWFRWVFDKNSRPPFAALGITVGNSSADPSCYFVSAWPVWWKEAFTDDSSSHLEFRFSTKEATRT